MSVKIDTFYVTPATAKKWLEESNTKNRPICRAQVDRLVRFMKDGAWHFDGAPIRFDKFGNLLDGQHRLTACVEADFPFAAVVIKGLEPESFFFMDQNRPRSASDNLSIIGKTNTAHLAAAGSWVLRYKTKKGQLSPRAEKMDVVDFCSRTPKLESCVAWAAHKRGLMSKSLMAALLFIFREIDDDQGLDFMAQITTGANLAEGSPALTFRNRVIAETSGRKRVDYTVVFAFAIYAWNSWRKGRQLKILRWNDGDDFPTAI